MKNLLLLLLTALLLAACSGNRQRYERVLDLAQRQNQNDDSITNVDSLHLAVAYFNRHGSSNEQMLANYLLGRAYSDMGESPRALHCYYAALSVVDTSKAGCDFKALSRVYGQMARLYLNQAAPQDALKELSNAYHCAIRANDTLMQLAAYEQKANVYKMLNMPESVLCVRENVSKLYLQYGDAQRAAMTLGPTIDILIEQGNYERARRYLHLYEEKSGLIDSGYNTIRKNKAYYYYKGMYYMKTGRLDSAEFFFRKEIYTAEEVNDLEIGYKGLLDLYRLLGKRDSAMRYSLLAYEMNDSFYREKVTEEYQRMHALYNYGQSQRLVRQKEESLRRMTSRARIGIMAVLLLSVATFLFIWSRQIKHQRAKHDFAAKQAILESEKDELEMLLTLKQREFDEECDEHKTREESMRAFFDNQRAELELLMEKKQQRMDELMKEMDVLNRKIGNHRATTANAHIRESDLVTQIKANVHQLSISEWKQIREIFQREVPEFEQTLRSLCSSLREEEIELCMLIWLNFSMKEISFIVGKDYHYLVSARNRLLRKIFGQEKGGAKEFDKCIKQLL